MEAARRSGFFPRPETASVPHQYQLKFSGVPLLTESDANSGLLLDAFSCREALAAALANA
jgi:hypothetical protein